MQIAVFRKVRAEEFAAAMNHILLLAAAAGLPDAVGRERAELHGALQQRIFRRGFEPVQQHVETGKPFRGRIEISGQVVVAERKIVPEERPCEVSEMEPIFQPAAFGVHPDQVLQLRPAQENGTGAQRITLSRDAVFITAASAGQPGNGEKEKLVGVVIRSPGSGLFCIPIPILSLQFRLERKTIRVGMSIPENVFSFAILHNPFPLFFARYQVIILK